ncbi:RagB/SusD family nutrient uptake outer membrane protein [Fulvivirga sp. M361]|uniref:RagB/SusD family nutrient uptake outer membrane protein n=1 Tax=Fulvivirga sp. M361 TaxID=2594266 RepID=UPI001624B9BC|nr:RagB/SusD family nutrient uptake outer membrane protein [Fulvivirga sp. M361]
MKKIVYSIVFSSFWLLSGCEDYLNKVEEFEGLQEEDVFSDIQLASDFLDGAYTRLIAETSARDHRSDWLPGMTMSDEGYSGRLDRSLPETFSIYAQGDYLSLMNRPSNAQTTPYFVDRYYQGWKGIRTVNTFIDKADQIQNSSQEEINSLLGQAYFLRAYFYHLMTKRHGGLVYLKTNLDLNASFDRERDTYANNVTDMLTDLDLAINLLPTSWDSGRYGRPTKGAAMALKSRITLFAASPLANTSGSQELWETAASAARDMIDHANTTGLYQFTDASDAINMDVDLGGTDLLVSEPVQLTSYRSMFVGAGTAKIIPEEVILMELNPLFDLPNGNFLNPIPRLSLTAGFDIIKGNTNPMNIGALAGFIDYFETKNGLDIDDDPSYDPQNPFINRDPRFYNAILFDGVPWQHTIGAINKTGFADLALVNEEGKRGLDLHDPATPASRLWRVMNLTGLRIRKWVPNGAFWQSGASGSWDFYVNNIHFRLAEIYLNYAEAVNEAFGPAGTAPGASLTALQAVNRVRNRVGMPDVNPLYSGSRETLRERIRAERAVELCFEGHRYDDLRRWKIAHLEEYKKVEFLVMRWEGGPTPTYPTGFSFTVEEQDNLRKTFNERHYWWPIPSSEIAAVPSFRQTPGW